MPKLSEREIISSKVVEALRAERIRQKLSMNALAERAGLHVSMISLLERHLRKPTLDVFLRIAAVLNVDLPRKTGKPPVHLFAGVVFCQCGQKMYVPSSTPKYVCQKCKNRIPAVDLEAIFLDELKGYLLSPERVTEYLDKANDTIGERTQLVETLTKELTKVKTEADMVYRLCIDQKITPDQFQERYQPLDERKKQIEAEIPKAEADLALLKIDGLSSEYIMEEARDLESCWPTMTTAEKQRIIENLVNRITVGTDEIDISLCYLPTFREMTNRQRMLTGSWRRRA